MRAKYFDGKTSKSYLVDIKKTSDLIQIQFEGGSQSTKYWKKDNTTVESFSSSDKVLLSYGEFPQERLEMTGSQAVAFAEWINEGKIIAQSYQKITRTNPVKLVLLSLASLVFVVYAYVFWVSPFVGDRVVEIIPISTEMKLGDIMFNNMSVYVADEDEVNSKLLNEFFEVCGFTSEYDIRISYADQDLVNAFAVPGGRILIYRGIIDKMNTWEELAALMAHELAHVNERHSFKQIARSLSGYLILSVLTGDVAGASTIVLENAYQIHQLSYSRSHEKEADIKGLEYLKKLQIRPDAMVDLFNTLNNASGLGAGANVSEGINDGLEYLSTHPTSTNRMKYLIEIISSDNEGFDYDDKQIPRAEEIWTLLKG